MRKNMSQMSIIQKDKYCTATELNLNIHLRIISSALDIILTRSSDSAHSEYDDIIKLLHILLVSTILTDAISKTYEDQLRSFSFSSD